MDMRILMISPKVRGIGGIAQHVSTLVERLRDRGHDVRVISAENLPILRKKGLRNPSFAVFASLRSFLRKFDVVHAHNVPSAIPMRLARGKRVLTIHGVYSENVEMIHGRLVARIGRYLERKAIEWADVLTVVSESAAQHYRSLGFKPVHIPNAIDLKDVPESGKRLYDRQVVYVGRLSKEKGVDVLIRAFRGVEGDLLIIGKGPQERELREMAKGVENVHFIGFKPRQEALRYIKGSDLLVNPSRSEGLSTAILEGMACKVPVIATSVGGNVELIRDGVTGILVPPNDPEELRKAVEMLLNDQELARRLVSRAYEVVLRKYSWEVVIEKYMEVYAVMGTG